MPFPILQYRANDVFPCPGCKHLALFDELIVCLNCLALYCRFCDYLSHNLRITHADWPCPYCPEEERNDDVSATSS